MKVKLSCIMHNLSCKVCSQESRFLAVECNMGGKLHLKQNIGLGTIVNKYHEGIVKRTLKRELEVPELVGNKANDTTAAM